MSLKGGEAPGPVPPPRLNLMSDEGKEAKKKLVDSFVGFNAPTVSESHLHMAQNCIAKAPVRSARYVRVPFSSILAWNRVSAVMYVSLSRKCWSGARATQQFFPFQPNICKAFIVKMNMGSHPTPSLSPIALWRIGYTAPILHERPIPIISQATPILYIEYGFSAYPQP